MHRSSMEVPDRMRSGRPGGGRGDADRRWAIRIGVALAVGGAVVVTSAALLLARSFDSGTTRIHARAPVLAQAEPDRPVVAQWLQRYEWIGDRNFRVIFVAPSGSSPPPPGLRRWPDPGASFVSPALLAAEPSVATRYGSLAGTIGPAGLADSQEWLVYARPPATFPLRGTGVLDIVGFGDASPDNIFTVLASVDRPPGYLAGLLMIGGWLLVVGLAVACGVAMGGATPVRRRSALLDWVVAPIGGALLGSAAAVAPLLTTDDLHLPWVGYGVFAVDLRHVAGQVPLVALAAAPVVLAAVVVGWVLARLRVAARPWVLARLRVVRRFAPAWPGSGAVLRWCRAAAGPALSCTLAALAALALLGHGPLAGRMFTALAWTVLPLAVACLPQVLARVGCRGEPGAPIAGDPWRQSRLILLTATTVVLAAMLLPWLAMGDQTRLPPGRQRAQSLGADPGVMVVRPTVAVTAEQFAQFSDGLGDGVRALSVHADANRHLLVEGDCSALRTLGSLRGPCPSSAVDFNQLYASADGPARAVRLAFLGGQPADIKAVPRPAWADYIVVIAGRSAWPRVKQVAYRTLPEPLILRPGEEWITTGWSRKVPLYWTYLCAALLVLLTLATAAALLVAVWIAGWTGVPARSAPGLTVAGAMALIGVSSIGLTGWLLWLGRLLQPADGPPEAFFLGCAAAVAVAAVFVASTLTGYHRTRFVSQGEQ